MVEIPGQDYLHLAVIHVVLFGILGTAIPGSGPLLNARGKDKPEVSAAWRSGGLRPPCGRPQFGARQPARPHCGSDVSTLARVTNAATSPVLAHGFGHPEET